MPLDTPHVYDIASDLLTSVVDRLTAAGITVPDRQYAHAGLVAWDCESVVVTVRELIHAFPGGSGALNAPGGSTQLLVCSPPRHVHMEAWIIRCVPVPSDNGDPPSAAALDASAEIVLADVWSLAYVLWAGYQAEEWGGRCASVMLGAVEVVGPEGGYVGVKADVFLLVT